jgi:hypothetical protein
MKRLVLLVVAFVGLFVLSERVGIACQECRYSAHNFGFCREATGDGYTNCNEYVADQASGRTDCNTTGTCIVGADGGGGGGGGGGGYCYSVCCCAYYY